MSRHSLPHAKRSKRTPYQYGEPWEARHKRRLTVALDDLERMRRHLASERTIIATYNDGAHWKIQRCGKLFEWWPESGRLVVDKHWDRAGKAHDVDHVVAVVRRLSVAP